jgi:D-lactate dehydrogenase (cytochrome)
MSGMDKIIAIHGASPTPICVPTDVEMLNPRNFAFSEEDSDLVCQPGVGWMEINETLKDKGIPLFFPVRAKC